MTTQVLDSKKGKAGLPLATEGRRLPRSTKAANLRVLVLALASFAIGTGVFVVSGLLGGVAREFSVPLGTAGQMAAVYAVAYALLSPVLVAATGRVARRRLLVAALSLFALANLAAVAAVGVGTLLPAVKSPTPTGRPSAGLAVVWQPAVLVTLFVTVLGMAAAFSVLTYVRPLLEELAGFGAGGIASMLLLFGLAGIAGSVLGGFGADRFGYRTNAVTVLIVLTFSLSAFSVLAVVGAAFVRPAAATALAAMAVAGFALAPLQQYRLIRTAPDEQNGVLALNEIASGVGQGLGPILGSLVLEHSSSGSLGWAGATCAAAALILAVLGSRFSDKG